MAQRPEQDAPTRSIAKQVASLRRARRWSGQQLAEAMTSEGVKWDRSIVANLENGRRRYVSVQEWLALAAVLEVAPLHLLVPIDGAEFAATPARTWTVEQVREWIRGDRSPDGSSPTWRRHRPDTDLEDIYRGLDEDEEGAWARLGPMEWTARELLDRVADRARAAALREAAAALREAEKEEEVTRGQHREAP